MKRLLIPIILMAPIVVLAQNQITDGLIINQIERMVDDEEEELDYTQLLDSYWSICENKIDINNPDELNQLIELHLVNLFIIENTYVNKGISLNDIYKKNFSTKQNNSGLGLWKVRKIVSKTKGLKLNTFKGDDYFKQSLSVKI